MNLNSLLSSLALSNKGMNIFIDSNINYFLPAANNSQRQVSAVFIMELVIYEYRIW